MSKADLVFLHAPSVFDFRKVSIMFGPVSDVVPSGPVFEMYPFGFTTIAEYLERYGVSTRIVNVAVIMLKRPSIDIEKFIASLKKPYAFGIDLHWLPHAHGSLELAKLVKKYHPDVPIIFGGFSATYFSKELINYPQVDFVMKGDSTEEPMVKLMKKLKNKETTFYDVPNLTWKDKEGRVYENPITNISPTLNHIVFDSTYNMRSVIRNKDLMGHIPFSNWLEYPIMPALTCRGCTRNCVTCGGSNYTFRKFFAREKIAFRDPELLVRDMARISQHLRGPVFVIGDIRQAGEDYVRKFFETLRKRNIKNRVCFEFFTPPPKEFFEELSGIIPRFSIEISLESHDEEIRRIFGKSYTNEEAENSIKAALELGCERVDVYFMVGLPKQTKESVLDTVSYCEHLYEKFNGDKRLLTFIAPMAPFLDPGSQVFENPEKFGYRLLYRTLEEHRKALIQPSWKYILNYETKWLTRDELVEVTYEAGLRLNRLKAKYKVIDEKTAKDVETRILQARSTIREIDEIMEISDEEIKKERLKELKERMERLSTSTVCAKKELEWPTHILNFRILPILKFIFTLPFRERLKYRTEEGD